MDNLTEKNFKEHIHKGKTAVKFWAEWCGPCKMLGPIYEEVSKEMNGIKFTKVNIDEESPIAEEHSVRGIPTIILFKDGEEVHRIVGFATKDALKSKIEHAFD
ncbi:MAG: thioredoxin [Candidatus Nanoarchaeia archaeon]